ncbi:MAG: SRPBCC family protein, partial [Deltaproteobacteria bacterium]|nr:SRPBCC family protein [Deltaproteobacteria bacterium]
MGCYNSVTVNAPVDKVWETLRRFHDFSWCPDVITKLEVVGDLGGTETGAKRILNGAFHETLLTLDDEKRTFSYSIDDGPDA